MLLRTCNAVNPTWSSGRRPKRRRNRQVQEIRTQSPAIERKSFPKNVYGLDGERLGQIRFLVLLFSLHSHTPIWISLHSIPYQHHTRQSKLFFRLFNSIPHDSRLPFDFRASCGSGSCCSFGTHTHTHFQICVSYCGPARRRKIFSSSRLRVEVSSRRRMEEGTYGFVKDGRFLCFRISIPSPCSAWEPNRSAFIPIFPFFVPN